MTEKEILEIIEIIDSEPFNESNLEFMDLHKLNPYKRFIAATLFYCLENYDLKKKEEL